ncbi:MAG: beta galactosidase jelly roll domain-containing protein [Ignavibacteriae bacterium]|nr:beta galactosidase jelly roll domain-containing protein [Ignavibacteriota bacterium]
MKILSQHTILGFLACLVMFVAPSRSEDFRLLYGLRGDWKFEIGDDARWSSPRFDDSKWETMFAPAVWEDEGFPGYDGYAWYRKHFQAESDWKGKAICIRLGRIDDVDQVFVNGKLIGATGEFPPDFKTAYNIDRNYYVPASSLNIPGDNVIAVRVYDERLGGGLVSGKLGIYEDHDALVPEIPLAGEWKFRTGDDPSWKERQVADEKIVVSVEANLLQRAESSGWSSIRVPGNWEFQGFGGPGSDDEISGYDGFAWYRIHFYVPKEYDGRRMILVLGKIDDYDETYLNGKLVGRTGTMGKNVRNSDAWSKLRAYTIPSGELIAGSDNVLAIRVFDGWRGGGIYQGPIGIASRERFVKWQEKSRRDSKSVFEWLFK